MSVDYFLRIVQKARHRRYDEITQEEVFQALKEFDIELYCLNAKADLIKGNQKILEDILSKIVEKNV